jgi:hypothetical protein
MLKNLDIRSSLSRTALTPGALSFGHAAATGSRKADFQALAKRWMR